MCFVVKSLPDLREGRGGGINLGREEGNTSWLFLNATDLWHQKTDVPGIEMGKFGIILFLSYRSTTMININFSLSGRETSWIYTSMRRMGHFTCLAVMVPGSLQIHLVPGSLQIHLSCLPSFPVYEVFFPSHSTGTLSVLLKDNRDSRDKLVAEEKDTATVNWHV